MCKSHNKHHLDIGHLLSKKIGVAEGHDNWALDDIVEKKPTLLACLECCRTRHSKPFFVEGYKIASDPGPQVCPVQASKLAI